VSTVVREIREQLYIPAELDNRDSIPSAYLADEVSRGLPHQFHLLLRADAGIDDENQIERRFESRQMRDLLAFAILVDHKVFSFETPYR
jgi:hypothetical protein